MFRYPMDVLHTERELDKKSLRSQHFHAIFAFLGTHVCFYYLLTVYLTPFDYLFDRAPFVAATARRRHAMRRIAAVQPNDWSRLILILHMSVCYHYIFVFSPRFITHSLHYFGLKVYSFSYQHPSVGSLAQ